MKRTNNNYVALAEYEVLKRLIDKKADLDTKNLLPEHFCHKNSKVMFRAINTLIDKMEDINEHSLYRECNLLYPEFDLKTIRDVFNVVVSESNFDTALDILTKQKVRGISANKLLKVVEHLNSVDDLSLETVNSMLYGVSDSLTSVNSGKNTNHAKSLLQCLTEYELDLLQRQIGNYYPFYDKFLDEHLVKKASPGQVILIAGSTGTGKSVYALNLINGLINNSVPTMYFSLEMDRESTMDRLMALRLDLPVEAFYKKGPDMEPALRRVRAEMKEVKDMVFNFIDDPGTSITSMTKQIREFKMTYKISYATVFVDLITQVKEFVTMGRGGNLATTMELAVNKLNALAKKEGVCIVAVAQMNREADSTRIESIDQLDRLRPTLNNIKNSNALGERSRSVLALFRKKYYAERLFPNDPELEFMEDELEAQIVKQSMGKVGTVGKYLFDGPQFKLTPSTTEEQETN